MYSGIASVLSPRPWLLISASPRSIVSVSGTTHLLFTHTQSIIIYYYLTRSRGTRYTPIWLVDYRHVSSMSTIFMTMTRTCLDTIPPVGKTVVREWIFRKKCSEKRIDVMDTVRRFCFTTGNLRPLITSHCSVRAADNVYVERALVIHWGSYLRSVRFLYV